MTFSCVGPVISATAWTSACFVGLVCLRHDVLNDPRLSRDVAYPEEARYVKCVHAYMYMGYLLYWNWNWVLLNGRWQKRKNCEKVPWQKDVQILMQSEGLRWLVSRIVFGGKRPAAANGGDAKRPRSSLECYHVESFRSNLVTRCHNRIWIICPFQKT